MNSSNGEGLESVKLVRCLERGSLLPKDGDTCILGDDLRLSYSALERFCCSNLRPVDIDLLLLAGLIAFADRNSPRNAHWVRNFHLELPVHAPEVWASKEVSWRLFETLRFLTGDYWTFKFHERKSRDERAFQLDLQAPIDEPLVIPFSGGLDSFAELKLFSVQHPNKTALLVSTIHNRSLSKVIGSTTDPRFCRRLRVPVSFDVRHHAESSFRTRTFLFFVVAATAARLSGCREIIVPENGQGSIGPSLIPSGEEHPFQSSHPGFTHRLSLLLKEIWGSGGPIFLHPNRWSTKAQVLRKVEAKAGLEGWQNTRSCSLNTKRYKGTDAPEHCGICSGCILRRLALLEVGLGYEAEPYLWRDLSASRLEESVDQDLRKLVRPTTQNDYRVAAAAVVDHKSLSNVYHFDAIRSCISRTVRELKESSNESELEVRSGLEALLLQHRAEWLSFVEGLGPGSWLVQLAAAN
jgi:7-cyano-7-deazaguanine synthase in queuosine biosynthesis